MTDSLRDLIARIDLASLVAQYTHEEGRRQGAAITFRCPNPTHPDDHPSFVVRTSTSGRQVWRCYSQCDRHGDALDLVQWIENLSKRDAIERLRQIAGEPAAVPAPRRRHSPAPITPRPTLARCSEQLLAKYAESRGWSIETVERFGLTVVLDSRGCERIRHPFLAPDERGEWVAAYWQDRGRRGVSPKWLSPAGRSPILYNLRSLESRSLAAVVICEGAPDTITATLALDTEPAIACVGVPGVGAWRPEWASLFTGLRVIVAADPDDAGRRLEESVTRSVPQPITIVRPRHGDLTDTAKTDGLDSIRHLLSTAAAVTDSRSDMDRISMILDAFPGSELLAEETDDE